MNHRQYIPIDLPYHVAIRACNLAHNLLGINAGTFLQDHEKEAWRLVVESPKKLSNQRIKELVVMLNTLKAVL